MHEETNNISISRAPVRAKYCVILRFLFDILVFFRLYERPLSSKECKMFPWKCLFSISDTNWSKNNFDDLYFVKVIFEEISSWKYFPYKFLLTSQDFAAVFGTKNTGLILNWYFDVRRTLKCSWKFKEVLYYLQNNKVCTLVVGWVALKL